MVNFGHFSFACQLHRHIGEVANDAVHLPAHVAHLRELGGLHLDERRVSQVGQAAGDFSLTDTCRTHHQDVLGRNLVTKNLIHLHAPPAIAERNGNRTLGVVLADDVLVELLDDFPWRHLRHVVILRLRAVAGKDLDNDIAVGVHADGGGNLQCLANDVLSR